MALKSLSSNERSKNLIFQISTSFVLKGLLFIITYIQFPIFSSFLNYEEFGLWMTLISFYNWFILFDFGIGHGLKNILTEKLTLNQHDSIKEYSSSGIIGTLVITIIFIVCFELLKLYLADDTLFKTSLPPQQLRIAINFTFYSCLILFLHNTLSAFLNTVQKASYTSYLNLAVNIVLILAVIFIGISKPSRLIVPIVFLSQINFVLYFIFFTIIVILFFYKYPVFIPRPNQISSKSFKDILNKGTIFFFIQISILAIYPIDSFIISHSISAGVAGDYNVIVKLYSIFLVIGAIVNQASWPSITEAFYKKDYKWLKQLFKKFALINSALIISLVVISFFLNELISLWMGKTYNFPYKTIVLASSLHIFFILGATFSTIVYAVNFLKSQIFLGVILILLKALLVYSLVLKFNGGLHGILISSLCCFVVFTFFNLFYAIRKFSSIFSNQHPKQNL